MDGKISPRDLLLACLVTFVFDRQRIPAENWGKDLISIFGDECVPAPDGTIQLIDTNIDYHPGQYTHILRDKISECTSLFFYNRVEGYLKVSFYDGEIWSNDWSEMLMH